MTADEMVDLRSIAATVKRIEETQRADTIRLDKLERFADRAEGALTISKYALSLLGVGGIALIISSLANRV